jgi:hypothetical protein
MQRFGGQIFLTIRLHERYMVYMSFNQMKQFILIILGLQGLCFTLVEAREQ